MRVFLLAVILVAGLAGSARADVDLFSRDTVSGIVDLRLGAGWGESSWTEGGFGKTRFGGGNGGDGSVRGQLADIDLVWNPSIDDFSLVLDVQNQPSQAHPVDLAQAYVAYRSLPTSNVRFMARAGLYYPPVSMEHGGYAGGAWTVVNTITPSAINAWIGQEVKVLGVEGEVRTTLWDQDLGAVIGVFADDDTSGTLLAFRGWSLDDVTATPTGWFPLPPMNSFIRLRQAPFTEPEAELSHSPGVYVRADWKLPSRLAVNAEYYDNRGDLTSVTERQWSWDTKFWNVGARFDVDAQTWLIGQAMTGSTAMGFPRGPSVWVDVDYSSAFLLATHGFGRSAITGRIETFQTSNQPFSPVERYSETGWAWTTDYRYALTHNVTLLGEVLHVWSDRPSRVAASEDPRQAQTTLQGSARLTF